MKIQALTLMLSATTLALAARGGGPTVIGSTPAQAGRPLTVAQLTPGNPDFLYAPSLLDAHWDEGGRFRYVLPDRAARATARHDDAPGVASADGAWRAVGEGDRLYVVASGPAGQRHEVSDPDLAYSDDKGQSDVVYGQAVHRNEFGIEGGLFWSPKGHRLAFYRMDQSMVGSYPLVQTDEREATVKWVKYPMAGMTSHQVRLGIYDPDTRSTVYLKTGAARPDAAIAEGHLTAPLPTAPEARHKALVTDPEHYLTCVTWRPDGRQIFVAELNRRQDYMELNVYDARTGDFVETLFSQVAARYVEPEHPLLFVPGSNDRFIWQDERDGYDHLYLYNLAQRGPRERARSYHVTEGLQGDQLTSGEWVVTEVVGISGGEVYFMSTCESPLERHLYAVDMSTYKVRRITTEPGVHHVKLSPDGSEVYDVYSGPGVARVCQLIDTRSGRREVLLSSMDPYSGYARPAVEVGTLPAADGQTPLYYRLVRPVGWQPDRRYPAIVYLYNGPHAQLVTAGYQYGLPGFDCYMAQLGYVVFTIDGRGSADRGLRFEQAIWHKLGDVESRDQMCGVEWLRSLPWVDAGRIGIFGWSYGGFMATYMMLRHPETFRAGVAGGAVLDWSRYEVMYGERYMGNPEGNPAAYRDNAMINHTGSLKGHLLLIHDDQDATVVPQMSIQFLSKAMREGGTYPDFYLYPNHEHNVRGRDRIHLHTKVAAYFEQWLK